MASWVDQLQAVSSAYTVISEVIFVFVLQRWQYCEYEYTTHQCIHSPVRLIKLHQSELEFGAKRRHKKKQTNNF